MATTGLFVAPASAGTGESGYCFDGGWTDVPILPAPITLGVETRVGLTESHVALCYATSEVGYGGAHTTGGLLKVGVRPDGTGYVECRPDSNAYVVLVDCDGRYDFNPVSGPASLVFNAVVVDTNVTTPATLGKTGFEIELDLFPSGIIGADPEYPCIWVNGTQLAPNCGIDIV